MRLFWRRRQVVQPSARVVRDEWLEWLRLRGASERDLELVERLFTKVTLEDGCWVWQAYRNSKGYGKWEVKGLGQLAHRVAYQLLVGPIPAGLTIDHLCRNRSCVNPEHLEVVSQGENTLRGDTFQARNAAKTHCPHGHPLSGENLGINPTTGGRFCRTCSRATKARYRDRARERRVAS